MMKKSLLALAVAGLSANAFAASLDYTTLPAPTANIVAKEVVTVTTATDLATTDTITFPLQFSATNQNLVRIDLSNSAKFGSTTAPTLTVDGIAASISEGGVGASFVVFQLQNTTTANQAAPVVLKLNGLTVANQGDVSAQYRLYDNQVDAHNASTRTLADKSYAYATFANALVFTANNLGASKQIDVTANSKKFVNGTYVSDAFGGLNLDVKANTYGTDFTTALTLEKVIGADAVVTVSGDFSAIAAGATGTTLGGIAATGVNTAKNAVTFKLGATGAVTPLADAQLVYATDLANTGIAPSDFNAKLTLGSGATLTAAPAEVSSFATLAKNGANAEVDLTMKPGGFYNDVVRITNKSGIAGDVFITVINDAGQSTTIKLGDIAGQTSTLAAGSSTQQLPISDIFAAAEAKGFALAGQGKLRLVVEAQIPAGSLSVQNWVVSTDGTTLSSF